MKLEEQVCSLELAKQLKTLGVKQESAWYWCADESGSWLRSGVIHQATLVTGTEPEVAAFTVAELGEMLPVGFWTLKKSVSNEVGDSWGQLCNWLTHKSKLLNSLEGNTEADARAKMIIYLLENKIINPKDL